MALVILNEWMALGLRNRIDNTNVNLFPQAIVKAHELRNKNKAELVKILDEQKQALASIRVQKVAGGKLQEM